MADAKQDQRSVARRLLIVGNPEEYHVGAHFLSAAKDLGCDARLLDVRHSESGNRWINRLFRRALRHRPAYLGRFSERVVAACAEFRPDLLLVTGIAAPHAAALMRIGEMGIQRANFLTDDPWNPVNGAAFFWPALCQYDFIFSPRRANLADLRRQGCPRVEYLPFAYRPAVHFPETEITEAERERFACDVAIVGGADADRLPIAKALIRAGLKVLLYGGYWDRDAELRPHWRGFVHGRALRLAINCARVNICLGRKANRDGHAMRSLELPAMQACLVVEDTAEHRELFGADGECVEYYRDMPELVEKVRQLCGNLERARQLGANVRRHICEDAGHTYSDRLASILMCCGLKTEAIRGGVREPVA